MNKIHLSAVGHTPPTGAFKSQELNLPIAFHFFYLCMYKLYGLLVWDNSLSCFASVQQPGNQAIIHMANRTIIKETRAVLTKLYPYRRPIYVRMCNCQLLKVPPRLTDCIISEDNNDFEKVVHTKSHIFI